MRVKEQQHGRPSSSSPRRHARSQNARPSNPPRRRARPAATGKLLSSAANDKEKPIGGGRLLRQPCAEEARGGVMRLLCFGFGYVCEQMVLPPPHPTTWDCLSAPRRRLSSSCIALPASFPPPPSEGGASAQRQQRSNAPLPRDHAPTPHGPASPRAPEPEEGGGHGTGRGRAAFSPSSPPTSPHAAPLEARVEARVPELLNARQPGREHSRRVVDVVEERSYELLPKRAQARTVRPRIRQPNKPSPPEPNCMQNGEAEERRMCAVPLLRTKEATSNTPGATRRWPP